MILKRFVLILIVFFGNIVMVKAETLEEMISSLETKVDTLIEQIDMELYPVGSIYVTTSTTSPGTTYGGTWEIYGVDKQLKGVGSNGTTTYTAGSIGGSNNVTLATANMSQHRHSLTASGTVKSTFTGTKVTTGSGGGHTLTFDRTGSVNEAAGYGLGFTSYYTNNVYVSGEITYTTSDTTSSVHSVTPKGTVASTFTGSSVTSTSVGSSTAFSVQNPYVTVYMWKRTA